MATESMSVYSCDLLILSCFSLFFLFHPATKEGVRKRILQLRPRMRCSVSWVTMWYCRGPGISGSLRRCALYCRAFYAPWMLLEQSPVRFPGSSKMTTIRTAGQFLPDLLRKIRLVYCEASLQHTARWMLKNIELMIEQSSVINAYRIQSTAPGAAEYSRA